MMTSSPTFLRRGAAALGLLVLLGACAGPQLHHHQLALLDKGMSPQQTEAQLRLAPLSVQAASAGGRQFEFQRYRLYNGVQADSYFLAFEGPRLTFWGYASEFRRQPDRDLNTAFSSALALFSETK